MALSFDDVSFSSNASGDVAEKQVLMVQAIIKLLNPLPCRRHLLIERRMQPERYQRDIPCTNCSILLVSSAR